MKQTSNVLRPVAIGSILSLVLTSVVMLVAQPASAAGGGVAPRSLLRSSVVASQQFGIADQTDLFSVDNAGALTVSWVRGGGAWSGPIRISPTGFAPPGAAVAASQQFGIANQTDVFVVDNAGALTVSWVQGTGTWSGPFRISPTGFAPPGAAVTASQQHGIPNQTDVFTVDNSGALAVSWVRGSGTWSGPVRISPTGLAPPGAAVAVSQQYGISVQTDVFVVDNAGALTVSWVLGAGTWSGPFRISPTGFAPPGAAVATSQQYGIANQTDVFTVDNSAALTVSWVLGAGTWNGPARISPTGFAPPGAAVTASQQYGIANQTDVFTADRTGLLNVSWVLGAGTWNAPALLGASATALTRLSSDPYTGGFGQHATEVEPDTYQWGSGILAAHQVARASDQGAMNIGWEFSPDAGRTWQSGLLPGITTVAGGPDPKASDPSVSYDARHGVWLIQTLAFGNKPEKIVVARSTDGVTWSADALSTQYSNSALDKNWITCDNWESSPYYGTCYGLVRDVSSEPWRLVVNSSTDGGVTW